MSITLIQTVRRWLARLVGALFVVGLLAPLAPAQASTPSPVTSVTWNLRTSWVDYLTNPVWYAGLGQGSLTNTTSNGGASTPASGSATTSWASGYTNYAYSHRFAVASDTGSPRTVTLKGGLDFDMSVHSIDISLRNLRIVDNPTGPEKLVVDGSYDPLIGSAVTLTNAYAFDVAETATSGVYVVTLTATGAAIFNGGSNGSYAAGEQFGSLAFAS